MLFNSIFEQNNLYFIHPFSIKSHIEKERPFNLSFSDDKSENEQMPIENGSDILDSINGKIYEINYEEEYKRDGEKNDNQESTGLTKKKFKIIKTNLGRKNKDKTDKKKGNHTSTTDDNLRRTIKYDGLKYSLGEINILIQDSDLSGKKKLESIKKDLINLNMDKKEKEKNKILKLLDTKLKDIFSTDLSDHHKKEDKKFNQNLINLIINNYEKKKKNKECSEKDEQIYDLLNSKFDIMLNKYASDFETIEKNVSKRYDDDEEKKKKYIQYLKNFKKNIENIEIRNKKK